MPKPVKCRILIVDDHATIREGLRAVFRSAEDVAVCGEAENGQQAIAAIEKLRPDLALVDVSLGREDGIELVQRLHQRWPALSMLVMSLHRDQKYSDRAQAAGARGYCAKGTSGDSYLAAVRQILQGQSFVSNLDPK